MKNRYFITTTTNLTIYALIISVFKPYFLSDNITSMLRVICLSAVILFLVKRRALEYFVNFAVPFGATVVISCILNYDNGNLSLFNMMCGFLYAFCIVCMCAMIKYCTYKESFFNFLICLKRILLLYFIISIVSILMQGSNALHYAFGSKFMTSYLFLLLSGVLYAIYSVSQKKSDRLIFVWIVCVSLVAMIYMFAITGLLTYIVFILICTYGKRFTKALSNRYVFIISIIMSMVVLISLNEILQLDIIQQFIVNVLHKDATLSDRIRYYSRALNVFKSGNIMYGAGYASSNLQSSIALGSNIQNGLLQHILEYGVIGGICFLYLCYKGITPYKTSREAIGLIAVLYAFVIAAIVEISYNLVFFMTVFLYYGLIMVRSKKNKL